MTVMQTPATPLDEAVADVLAVVRRGKHRPGTSSETYEHAEPALHALNSAVAASGCDAAVSADLLAALLACSKTVDAGAVQAVLVSAAYYKRAPPDGTSAARQAQLVEAGFVERALACLGSSNKYTQGDAAALVASLTFKNRRACRLVLQDPGSLQALAQCCFALGAGSALRTGEGGKGDAWVCALRCAASVAAFGGEAGARAVAAHKHLSGLACGLLGSIEMEVVTAALDLLLAVGGGGPDGSGLINDGGGRGGDDGGGGGSEAGSVSDSGSGSDGGGGGGGGGERAADAWLKVGGLDKGPRARLVEGLANAVREWPERLEGAPDEAGTAKAARTLGRGLRLLRLVLAPDGMRGEWPGLEEELARQKGFLPALARLGVATHFPGPPDQPPIWRDALAALAAFRNYPSAHSPYCNGLPLRDDLLIPLIEQWGRPAPGSDANGGDRSLVCTPPLCLLCNTEHPERISARLGAAAAAAAMRGLGVGAPRASGARGRWPPDPELFAGGLDVLTELTFHERGVAVAPQAEGLCALLERLVRPGAAARLHAYEHETPQDVALRLLADEVLPAVRVAAARGQPQLRASPATTGGRLAAALRGVLAWALRLRCCRGEKWFICQAEAAQLLTRPLLRAVAFPRLEGRLGSTQPEDEAAGWQALLDDLPRHLRLAVRPMFDLRQELRRQARRDSSGGGGGGDSGGNGDGSDGMPGSSKCMISWELQMSANWAHELTVHLLHTAVMLLLARRPGDERHAVSPTLPGCAAPQDGCRLDGAGRSDSAAAVAAAAAAAAWNPLARALSHIGGCVELSSLALLALAVVEARRSVDVAAALGNPSCGADGRALLDSLRGALTAAAAEALSPEGQAQAQQPPAEQTHGSVRPLLLDAAAKLPLGRRGTRRRFLEEGWVNTEVQQLLSTMGQRLAAVKALVAPARPFARHCGCLGRHGVTFDPPCLADDGSVEAALRAVRSLYTDTAPCPPPDGVAARSGLLAAAAEHRLCFHQLKAHDSASFCYHPPLVPSGGGGGRRRRRLRACTACGAHKVDGITLRRCRGCGAATGVRYCSHECCERDWENGHKLFCRAARAWPLPR